MRGMTVQIYEIQNPEEARLVAGFGVDHLGTVLLAPESADDPKIHRAVEVARESGRVSCVIPLFTDLQAVCRAVEILRPHIIHFCDDLVDRLGRPLDPAPFLALQKAVRDRFSEVKIMRSIPIALAGQGGRIPSLEIAEKFALDSDYFLTDTWLGGDEGEPVGGFIGITGKTCDWDVAARLVKASPIPVILAGGIGPENVREGILKVRPAGVDSCTLTNAVDGEGRPIRFKKDPEKVEKMVAEARKAHELLEDKALSGFRH